MGNARNLPKLIFNVYNGFSNRDEVLSIEIVAAFERIMLWLSLFSVKFDILPWNANNLYEFFTKIQVLFVIRKQEHCSLALKHIWLNAS